MSQENVFDLLHPSDGYHVKRITNSLSLSLYVGVNAEGTLATIEDAGDVEVWSKVMPEYSKGDFGEQCRNADVLEALCRYFNTGGQWDDLMELIESSKKIIKGPLVFDGWVYFEGYRDVEGSFTNIWKAEEDDSVVRWVVGSFIDTALTMEDLLAEEKAEQADEGFVSELEEQLQGTLDFHPRLSDER